MNWKHLIKKILKKSVSRNAYYYIFEKYLNRELIYHPNFMRDAQLNRIGESVITQKDHYLEAIFDCYYNQKDPNLIVPSEDVSSVSSYVPYYRGFTTLVINNFFNQNYGIRDPILIRVSLSIPGKNFRSDKVIWAKQSILKANMPLLVKDPFTEENDGNFPKHGILIVEAFHPRISITRREFRFWVLYQNKMLGSISIVHSLAFARIEFTKRSSTQDRCYGPDNGYGFYFTTRDIHKKLKGDESKTIQKLTRLTTESKIAGEGFITIEDENGCPLAIWHDAGKSSLNKIVTQPKTLAPSHTVFFVPNYYYHAPYIQFKETQIGFRPEKVMVKAHSLDGDKLAEVEYIISSDNDFVDSAELFEDFNIEGSIYIIVDFQKDMGEFIGNPACHVHIFYRCQSEFSDQVLSENTKGYWIDSYKKPKSYRCRKFAPLLKKYGLDSIYTFNNLDEKCENPDNTIKLRVFTDQGYEAIIDDISVLPGGLSIISGHDILSIVGSRTNSVAIIQFEHESTNFTGHSYFVDRITNRLGVDHLTGG